MTGIQRFRMRLMKYSFKILHVPGKELVTADTLSREPLDKQLSKEDERLNEDLTCTFHTSWRAFKEYREYSMS